MQRISILVFTSFALTLLVQAQPLVRLDVPVRTLELQVDTRSDIAGLQAEMAAVLQVPSAVSTYLVGSSGDLLSDGGLQVVAELSGPAFVEPLRLITTPNAPFSLPGLRLPGTYQLNNVRLLRGTTMLLRRDPLAPPVLIEVVEKLLVTEVTSRPLTQEEIVERGIIIDTNSFEVVDFTVGIAIGSEEVLVEVPLVVPLAGVAMDDPSSTVIENIGFTASGFVDIPIPNLSITGFSLSSYDCPENLAGCANAFPDLPPIHGVIVIPGDIGFLNEFFSVIVMASNVAPQGSGLTVSDLRATVILPPGRDDIGGTGDDPLALASTVGGGNQPSQDLSSGIGAGDLMPGDTASAEYLIEGKREGTHLITFELQGMLQQPAADGVGSPVSGTAAGLIMVKNPTFDIVLAHPQVVQEGEVYSFFATVTNTSNSPANSFQLTMQQASFSGVRLATDEVPWRTLNVLAPGEAHTFRFLLQASKSGKVGGTVALVDEGIQGSFVLTSGIGAAVSPTTLIVPSWVNSLPGSLVDSTVRLLSQSYSAATSPFGVSSPTGRIAKSTVRTVAQKFALTGLYKKFGQPNWRTAADIAYAMLFAAQRPLGVVVPDIEIAARTRESRQAMSLLRHSSQAGRDWQIAIGKFIGESIASSGDDAEAWQREVAAAYASFAPVTSVFLGASADVLSIDDSMGIHCATLPLRTGASASTDGQLYLSADDLPPDELIFQADQATNATRVSVVVSDAGQQIQLVYVLPALVDGGFARLRFVDIGTAGVAADLLMDVDSDADGAIDLEIPALEINPIVERGPQITGVAQWGSGHRPLKRFDNGQGDPLGTLVAVVFDEPLDPTSAALTGHYMVEENLVLAAALQSSERLVLLSLKKPVGHLIARDLNVFGIIDVLGNVTESSSASIVLDPDLGVGGLVEGVVRGADGAPIPLASIDYIQPKSCTDCLLAGRINDDQIISRFQADTQGRYRIEYVLQNSVVSERPDRWLNQLYATGTNHFKLEATDPLSGHTARASTRVHYDGQKIYLDLVVRGFGSVQGQVFDDAGTAYSVGAGQQLIAESLSGGVGGVTWVDDKGGYAFPWKDGARLAPLLSVGNVTLGLRYGNFLGLTTVNIPYAGAVVFEDLQLYPINRFGEVSGVVLEFDGVTPAPGVPVKLRARGFGAPVVQLTASDGDGRFAFTEVPEGNISVRAIRESSAEQTTVRSFATGGEMREVVLLLPGSGAVVRGFVVDSQGALVPFAEVVGASSRASADEFGAFALPGLPVGRFNVYAASFNRRSSGSREVQINRPSDRIDIVISLVPTAIVQGVVYRANGVDAVPNQVVQLWSEKGMRAQTRTDGTGAYVFEDLPLDAYDVRSATGEYGDGGIAHTTLRFAGDVQNADIIFRGRSRIVGRVLQADGTPAIADVLVYGPVWRVIPSDGGLQNTLALESEALRDGTFVNESLIDSFQQSFVGVPDLFIQRSEWFLSKSDTLDASGAVTGDFTQEGLTGGSYTISAFGPFYAPTTVNGTIARASNSLLQEVDVGDIYLTPSTGVVAGRVLMPDGLTPAGSGVRVRLRSVGNFGYTVAGQVIPQAATPTLDVFTDAGGNFEFPLVFVGQCEIVADTGVPLVAPASGADIVVSNFDDLNVRLYGQQNAVVPPGATLTVDLRLAGAVAIAVAVVENDGFTRVPGATVSLQTVANVDSDEETSFQAQMADAFGAYTFLPVIEGLATLTAQDPTAGVGGWANVRIEVNPGNGRVLPVTIKLGVVSNAQGEETPVPTVSSVSGTVFRSDGTVVAHPTEVRVSSSGADFLTVTGEDGSFAFSQVPTGAATLRAFEPFTARTGTTSIYLSEASLVADISLVGLGTVNGVATFSDGVTLVPGAVMTLTPQRRSFTKPLRALADNLGGYSFPGVPIGEFEVRAVDLASGLGGVVTGAVAYEGEQVSIDVSITGYGAIAGTVYMPGVLLVEGEPRYADGTPWPDAPTAVGVNLVVLAQGQVLRSIQTDALGEFASGPYLPLGTYQLRASSPSSDAGALGVVVLSRHGEVFTTAMVLMGTGAVGGVVLDSAGVSLLQGVEVTLRSASPFAAGERTKITDNAGLFRFDDVAIGPFTLALETTLSSPALGASVSDVLGSSNGTAVDITFSDNDADLSRDAIRLESAATIKGVVLLEGGADIAVGAVVSVSGTRAQQVRVVDANGAFEFSGLPLGIYQVVVLQARSNGRAQVSVELLSNAELQDLGNVVLDATAPVVLSVVPTDGAYEVPVMTPVVVQFSEPVTEASISEQTFEVRSAGSLVAGSRSLSIDRTALTFVPTGPWVDRSWVDITLKGDALDLDGQVLSAGVRDEAGHGLSDSPYRWSFSIADATPPYAVSVSPAAGANGVLPTEVIRFTFSEAMNVGVLNNLRLENLSTGEFVLGDTALSQGDRVLVFVPRAPLAANSVYRASTNGADQSGLALPTMVSSSFSTIDTLGPSLVDLRVPGLAIQGGQVMVIADIDPTVTDQERVEFFVNGMFLGAVSADPYQIPFLLSVGLGSSVQLSAVAVDTVGNRGTERGWLLPIAANTPPSIEFLSPLTGSSVDPGDTIVISLRATDDVALTQFGFTADEGTLAAQSTTVNQSFATMVEGSYALTIPPEFVVGDSVVLRATAVDSLDQRYSTTTVLSVVDSSGPEVAVVSPTSAALLVPGEPFNAVVSARDGSGLASIAVEASGALTASERRPLAGGVQTASETFLLTLPLNALPTGVVTLKGQAVDILGNIGSGSTSIAIADISGPTLTLLAPAPLYEPGDTVYLEVTADDDLAVAEIQLSGAYTEILRPLPVAAIVAETVPILIPADTPLGSALVVSGFATDTSSNAGPLARAIINIGDRSVPSVSVRSPVSNATLDPRVPLVVRVMASDNIRLTQFRVELRGAIVAEQVRDVTYEGVAAQNALEEFSFSWPNGMQGGEAVVVRAYVGDGSGEGISPSVVIRARDVIAPQLTSMLPGDGSVVFTTPTIEVAFDEAIDPSSVTPDTFSLTSGAIIAGNTAVTDNVARFVVDTPLSEGLFYRVRVDGITDFSGNAVVPFEFGFQVQEYSPLVADLVSQQDFAVNAYEDGVVETIVRLDSSQVTDGHVYLFLASSVSRMGTDRQVVHTSLDEVTSTSRMRRGDSFITETSGSSMQNAFMDVRVKEVGTSYELVATTHYQPRFGSGGARSINHGILGLDLDSPGLVRGRDWVRVFGFNRKPTITFTPDGRSSYLVMGFSHSTSRTNLLPATEMSIDNITTGERLFYSSVGDVRSNEIHSYVGGTVLDVPSSQPTTLRVSSTRGAIYDSSVASLVVLRLDAFSNSAFVQSTARLRVDSEQAVSAVNIDVDSAGQLLTLVFMQTELLRYSGEGVSSWLVRGAQPLIENKNTRGVWGGIAPGHFYQHVATYPAGSTQSTELNVSTVRSLYPAPYVTGSTLVVLGTSIASRGRRDPSDVLEPTVTLTEPIAGSALSIGRDINFQIRASDDSTLEYVAVRIETQARVTVLHRDLLLNALVASSGVDESFTWKVPTDTDSGARIMVTPIAADAQGNTFSGPMLEFVAADVDPPQLVRYAPGNGSVVVANLGIEIEFDEALDPSSVNSSSVALEGTGVLPGSLSLASSNRLIHFLPEQPLVAGTTYVVSVAGVTDVAGNGATPLSYSFSVGSMGPQIVQLLADQNIAPLLNVSGSPKLYSVQLPDAQMRVDHVYLLTASVLQKDFASGGTMRATLDVDTANGLTEVATNMVDGADYGGAQNGLLNLRVHSADARYRLATQSFGTDYTTWNHSIIALDTDSPGLVRGRDLLYANGRPVRIEFTPDGLSSYMVLAFSQDSAINVANPEPELLVDNMSNGTTLFYAQVGNRKSIRHISIVGGAVLNVPTAQPVVLRAQTLRGGLMSPGYTWLVIVRLDAFATSGFTQSLESRRGYLKPEISTVNVSVDSAGRLWTLGFVQTELFGAEGISGGLRRNTIELMADTSPLTGGPSPGHFYQHVADYAAGSLQTTTLELSARGVAGPFDAGADITGSTLVVLGTALTSSSRRNEADLMPPQVSVLMPTAGMLVVPGDTVEIQVAASDDSTLTFVGTRIAYDDQVTVFSRTVDFIGTAATGVVESFFWQVPAGAPPGWLANVRALAADAQGNSSISDLTAITVGVAP